MRRDKKALYERIMMNVAKQVKKALNEDIQDDLSPEEKAIERIKQLFKIFKPADYDIDTDPEDGCTVNTKDGAEIFITRVVYDETNDKLDIYGAFTEADFYNEQNEYDSEEEMYYALGNSLFDCSEFDLDGLDSLFYIVRNGMYWYADDMADEEFYRITDNI